MQIEKLTYSLAVMPESKALLASVDRVSLVGSAADRLSTSLPDLLAHERQALISQLTQELDAHRETLSALTGEVRSTLQAGTETANALHATLQTLDRISARYPPREESAGANPSPPFDIREYTEMIRELSATTRDLNALAQSVDSTLPAVRRATQDAAGTLQQVTNRLFWQLLILVVVAVVATTLGALAYRVAVTRIQRRSASNL
jgi:methyl-accepting chemotaxis protein